MLYSKNTTPSMSAKVKVVSIMYSIPLCVAQLLFVESKYLFFNHGFFFKILFKYFELLTTATNDTSLKCPNSYQIGHLTLVFWIMSRKVEGEESKISNGEV